MRWFRLAADQGHADAQFELGVKYETGEGVPQDDAEAVRWYRLAAEQGYVGAQHNLGFAYRTGAGVPQDDTEAVRWFRLAAEQGHADAQFALAVGFAEGLGVSQDDVQAYLWYTVAYVTYQTGDEREMAVEYRDVVAERMTPEQIAEAQRLACAYDTAHPREP